MATSGDETRSPPTTETVASPSHPELDPEDGANPATGIIVRFDLHSEPPPGQNGQLFANLRGGD